MFLPLLITVLLVPSALGEQRDWFDLTDAKLVQDKQGQFYAVEYRAERATLSLGAEVRVERCLLGGLPCPQSAGGYSFSPNLASIAANELKLGLRKGGHRKDFTINLLPKNFPYMRLTGRSSVDSPLIFSVLPVQDGPEICHLMVLSPLGHLRFYRQLEGLCFDFRPHDVAGQRFYSYQRIRESITHVGHAGPRVILDSSFREVEVIAPDGDGHEFHYLGSDHWIGIEFGLGRLSNGRVYFDRRIVERKAGRELFSWGVSDYFRQHGSELTPNALLTSYRGEIVAEVIHINAIQVHPTGLLVGLGTNGVGFLNRKERKLEWELGGIADDFRLTIDQHPNFFHTPNWDHEKNELVLFSNRSHGVAGEISSRVLRYTLAPKQKRLLKYEVLRDRKELSYLMGSVQKTNAALSIGFGSKNNVPYDFVEMAGGKDVWTLSLAPGHMVYRFYRKPY